MVGKLYKDNVSVAMRNCYLAGKTTNFIISVFDCYCTIRMTEGQLFKDNLKYENSIPIKLDYFVPLRSVEFVFWY